MRQVRDLFIFPDKPLLDLVTFELCLIYLVHPHSSNILCFYNIIVNEIVDVSFVYFEAVVAMLVKQVF